MTSSTEGHLCDMSETGARFEAPDLPGAGATAVLSWGNHEAVCTIAWSEGQACGLAFRQHLPVDVVEQTAALNRVVELPIASVGNIVQGRRRILPFRKTEPAQEIVPEVPNRLSSVLALFGRRQHSGT